jgi:hypothetical protein
MAVCGLQQKDLGSTRALTTLLRSEGHEVILMSDGKNTDELKAFARSTGDSKITVTEDMSQAKEAIDTSRPKEANKQCRFVIVDWDNRYSETKIGEGIAKVALANNCEVLIYSSVKDFDEQDPDNVRMDPGVAFIHKPADTRTLYAIITSMVNTFPRYRTERRADVSRMGFTFDR